MARNVAATDAGVGQANITTKIKLTIQAAKKCFYFGAVPGFIIPLAFWIYLVSPQNFDLVKIHLITFVADSDTPRKWRLRDVDGVRKIVTVSTDNAPVVQYFTSRQIKRILAPVSGPIFVFDLVFFFSIVSGVLSYLALWQKFVTSGIKQQTNKRIHGASQLISPDELDKRVKDAGGGEYTLVDVAIPLDAPMKGILAIGAQGSGKSIAIHDFMQQVFARKKKCIIYDQSGEFYRAYFRPGKDFFFNPACLGSVPWSIFKELRYTYDSNTLAQAFLPPKASSGQAGANSFFEDAARALFAVILLRLYQRGAEDTRDIARAFIEMPPDEMSALIEKSVASSAIAGDSKGQRQGVLSSISIYLDGIASVNSGSWSINDFLESDDDARLFLFGTDDTKAMFGPLYRLILAVAFASIAAKQEIVHEDKYWFLLDEIHTLGDIKVDEHLATLRKFGVCVFAGTQNDSQFSISVGKERAEVLMNGFHSILQLAMNDPSANNRASERLGKLEMETIGQNQAVAVVEQRDGAGIVITEQEKWLVMPADIKELGVCNGYLRFSGPFPAAKVDYSHWLPKRKKNRGLRRLFNIFSTPARVDRFKEIQGSPPRDERFKIARKVLPAGQTAFDDVRLEVEAARAAAVEAEREKEKEKSTDHATANTNLVAALAMTSGSSIDAINDEKLQAHDQSQDLKLGL